MCTALMHVYRTARLDMPEYFRAESSQANSVNRKKNAQDI